MVIQINRQPEGDDGVDQLTAKAHLKRIQEGLDSEPLFEESFIDILEDEFIKQGFDLIDSTSTKTKITEDNSEQYRVLAAVYGGNAKQLYISLVSDWGYSSIKLSDFVQLLLNKASQDFYIDTKNLSKIKEAYSIALEYQNIIPKADLNLIENVNNAVKNNILINSTLVQSIITLINNDKLPYRKKFVVSAYYSPLPNQSRYSTGTYEGDINLNGGGELGYWETPVFQGMVAAPSGYPKGMRIALKDMGIFSVEDRGGAIVKKGKRGYKYDRLDVWMGKGEEALLRALKWGKREVEGVVFGVRNDIEPVLALASL